MIAAPPIELGAFLPTLIILGAAVLVLILDLLPPLRPRYYSISSSPLMDPTTCSLTVGVVEAPARSGHGVFRGVASRYLSVQPPNSTVFGFVRKPTIPFRPPDNPHLPMIMVGPGTGIALPMGALT